MGVNGEALQLWAWFLLQVKRESVSVLQVTQESVSRATSHTRICIWYYKSHENLYQVLQVTRESVSGATSHTRIHIRCYKSRMCLNVQWNRRFVWYWLKCVVQYGWLYRGMWFIDCWSTWYCSCINLYLQVSFGEMIGCDNVDVSASSSYWYEDTYYTCARVTIVSQSTKL